MLLLNYLRKTESNTYAAFTLTGFDDQERNLTFVKTDFQVLKLKFHACSKKLAFYPLHKQNKFSFRYLVVKPACVNAALSSNRTKFSNLPLSLSLKSAAN